MQRIAGCYPAFDRRKGSNPFLESGNEPTNPSVSFSIPISSFEKARYTAKPPPFAKRCHSRGIHGPLASISLLFLPPFSFSFSLSLPPPLLFLPLLLLFCGAPFDSRKYHVSAAKKKKKRKKSAYSYTDCYRSRMYPLHAGTARARVKTLPGESVGRSNGLTDEVANNERSRAACFLAGGTSSA